MGAYKISKKILYELGENVFTEFGDKKRKESTFIDVSITKFSYEIVARKTSPNSVMKLSLKMLPFFSI